uniref:RNA-binding protein 25 n=1 Tax=Aegilops tauschii TaxID=37682 RepID=M8B1Y9_AEGTA
MAMHWFRGGGGTRFKFGYLHKSASRLQKYENFINTMLIICTDSKRPAVTDGAFGPGAVTRPPITPVPPANVFGLGAVTRPRPFMTPVPPANVFGPGAVTRPPIAFVPPANVFGPGAMARPPIALVPPANVFGPGAVARPPITPVPPANVFGPGAVARPPIAPVPSANVFGPGAVTRPPIAPVPSANVFGPGAVTRPPITPVPPANVFGHGAVTRPPIAPAPPANVFGHGAVTRPPMTPVPPATDFGPGAVTRPHIAPVPPVNEPQFKVYVGKIASTVDNDFVLSLLQVCGIVKSWNPVINPIDGTPTGFGFCDFESAEGSLRAWRLLNKLRIDGQELLACGSSLGSRLGSPRGGSAIVSHDDLGNSGGVVGSGLVHLSRVRRWADRWAHVPVNVNEATRQHLQKYCENTTEEKANEIDMAAMQTIHSMVEERMRCKFLGSPIQSVQASTSFSDEKGDGHTRSGALEERTSKRQREKEEHLGESKVVCLQGWKDKEVISAGKPSLQIDAISSMYVPMEPESTIEHERKRQRREIDGFHKSNGEGKGIVSLPVLVSDKLNSSAPGEKVSFELQATSKSGNKETFDAEQLLAAIPKTKEELFAYDVNWAIYDKHGLHERMRHWVSEKSIEVFGEEIAEFVEYVVASTKEHCLLVAQVRRVITKKLAQFLLVAQGRVLLARSVCVVSGEEVKWDSFQRVPHAGVSS